MAEDKNIPEEIQKQFDITNERIRKIEEKAARKLNIYKTEPRCSFCGKSTNEVRGMLASGISTSHICDECVKICLGLLSE